MVNTSGVFLIVFTLLIECYSAHAQELRDSFRRVKSAVVVVHSSRPEGRASSAIGDVDDEGLGSGVLISADGKILTAAHVVQKENGHKVEFADGQRTTARIIATSPSSDLALLQVDRVPGIATPATLGNSDNVETGDDIFIVGAPYGLSYTLTVGRITARRPDETRGGILSTAEFLQTDAVISPGNSGSPVFNKNGEVVAIVSGVISDSGNFDGVGFAATINTARSVLLDGVSLRAGIEGVLVTGVVAKALNLPQPAGFLITSVQKDSPAEKIGLMGGQLDAMIDDQGLVIGGDVILAINGIAINGDRQARRIVFSSLATTTPGILIRYKVLRAGKVVELLQNNGHTTK